MYGEFLFEFEFLGKVAHEQAAAGVDLTGVRAGGAGGHLQEGGFAAAIASHQADAFPFENRNCGVLKEGVGAKGDRDIRDAEDRLGWGCFCHCLNLKSEMKGGGKTCRESALARRSTGENPAQAGRFGPRTGVARARNQVGNIHHSGAMHPERRGQSAALRQTERRVQENAHQWAAAIFAGVPWSAERMGLGLTPKTKMQTTSRAMTALLREETWMGAVSVGSYQYIAATTRR